MLGRSVIAACMLVSLGSVPCARADWINLTGAETAPNIAEITIENDRVRLVLEIYRNNIAAFGDLVPDDWMKQSDAGRPRLAERLRRFSSKVFSFVTDRGERLRARLELIEPRLRKDRQSRFAGTINPYTRQRVPEAPADKRVLYAELSYPFKTKPKTLTIIPPLDDEGRAKLSIGFIAYHKAVPVIDFRYLGAPAKVALDWDDPWYTKFENPNLKRHHKSAMMSFLYVEPREVRHEMLLRVRDLREWTDLGLGSGATISADEQARVKDRARAFLTKRNALKLDGAPSIPSSSRAEFLKISLTGLQLIEGTEPLDLSTAILGVIMSYPVKRLPRRVSVEWELFNRRIERIPTSMIDPAGPVQSFVTARDPTIEWRNFLRKYEEPKVSPIVLDDGRSISVPALSLVLIILCFGAGVLASRPRLLPRRGWVAVSALGAVAAVIFFRTAVFEVKNPFSGPPDKETSAQIVERMLTNVNHAFVEIESSALRRALEVIVGGDRSKDIEVELKRALAIKVPGGGIARVHAIEDLVIEDITELDDSSGFRTLARWTAKASAGHWGHAHRRTIRFQALMELAEVEGVWKLIGLTVVDAKLQS